MIICLRFEFTSANSTGVKIIYINSAMTNEVVDDIFQLWKNITIADSAQRLPHFLYTISIPKEDWMRFYEQYIFVQTERVTISCRLRQKRDVGENKPS